MSKYIIGEAANSETGNLVGRGGDQTGNEVRMIDLYNLPDRPWEYVYRCTDPVKRETIGEAMIQACINDNVGYSQTENPNEGKGIDKYATRYGVYWAMIEVGGIIFIQKPVNCDCSSLVAACCIISGIDVTRYMDTRAEDKILMQTGLFEKIPYTIGMKLYKGDILWRYGHTAAVTHSDANQPSKEPQWVGSITYIGYANVYADELMQSYLYFDLGIGTQSVLGEGNLVDVCDTVGNMYYIRIAGKYYGYIRKAFVEPYKPKEIFEKSRVIFNGSRLYGSSYEGSKSIDGTPYSGRIATVKQIVDRAHNYLIDGGSFSGWANKEDLTVYY